MSKNILKHLHRFHLLGLFSLRKKIFKNAAKTPLPVDYPVNKLAKRLHPEHQFVRISKIIEHSKDCKTYFFSPILEKGTEELAYFSAGQYIVVSLQIGEMKIKRPYSLSSSPKEALEGHYSITVKRVKGGIASSYILDNWKEGDEVSISGPEGEFEYVSLRDEKYVIGIAGGSGITPFLSMAKAIAGGDEDFNLILLYGSKSSSSILFKDEFDALAKKCDRIKVIHVLSEENKKGYEHGFIDKELIEKYAPKEAYSVFISGPQPMHDYLDDELRKMGIERKRIRHELYGEIIDPSKQNDYPAEEEKEVQIKVTLGSEKRTLIGNSRESILRTLERNGLATPSKCRSGVCGYCHAYLKSGKVYSPKKVENRRKADLEFSFIHLCCSFPLSDVEIEVPFDK